MAKPVATGVGLVNVTLIDPSIKYPLKLVDKEIINHDTIKFRFELPSPDHILGISTGQHVFLSYELDGEIVERPYTPITNNDVIGYMDLVIKILRKNVHPKFPAGGKMTQYLENMKTGDYIDVRGPSGLLIYKGKGMFDIRPDEESALLTHHIKKVNMIAEGVGITPMLQLIRAVFNDPNDKTELNLLYANQTENDILLRRELEDTRDKHPHRFNLWYTVYQLNENWQYSTGSINEGMIKEHMFPPSDDTMVYMCSHSEMIKSVCIPILDKLGYNQKLRFSY